MSSQITTPEPLSPISPASPDIEKEPLDSLASPPFNHVESQPYGRIEDHIWEQSPYFKTYISLAVIMTIWPWIFFAAVSGGRPLHLSQAKFVEKHPQGLVFLVTAIGAVISVFIGVLFSRAVNSIARQWVTHKQDADIFHVSFFNGLQDHRYPWGVKDIPLLLHFDRLPFAVTIFLYLVLFILVNPGITTLISPIPIYRTAPLNGTELDFSSTESECVSWFQGNRPPSSCGWETFNGYRYTSCLAQTQMPDVLESGNGNILISVANISLALAQLGGLHFLGSMRGVLPLGRNGVPGLDFISNSTADPQIAASLTYNYTLGLQGVSSNVSCKYDTETPIVFTNTTTDLGWVITYDGTCPNGQEILQVGSDIIYTDTHLLAFMVCETTANTGGPYTFYFSGGPGEHYQTAIGDLSCTLSSELALFDLTYSQQLGAFRASAAVSEVGPTFTELIHRAVNSVGEVAVQAQSSADNLIASTVITVGTKYFDLQPYEQNSTYLRLYEQMIQGMFEYEVTYIRMLYMMQSVTNETSPVPSSCMRSVEGSIVYQIPGWLAKGTTAGYLVPITIVNLTSVILLIIAMRWHAEGKLPRFDPTNPVSVIIDRAEHPHAIVGTEASWKIYVNHLRGRGHKNVATPG